jgi:uncharacterized membrane protein
MEENRRLFTAVFGAFAAFGVLTAVIAGVVATQAEGDERSAFEMVALIAVVLAVVTGFVALAAWRRWWPLRESPVPSAGGFDPES